MNLSLSLQVCQLKLKIYSICIWKHWSYSCKAGVANKLIVNDQWPVNRRVSVGWCTWFCIELMYLKWTLFNQYSRKYKIIHQLVGHVYSLVPRAMADHRLAWQMPWRCCCLDLLLLRDNHDLGITDFSLYLCITYWGGGTLYLHVRCATLVLVTLILTGRSQVVKKFSSRRQVGHPWCKALIAY